MHYLVGSCEFGWVAQRKQRLHFLSFPLPLFPIFSSWPEQFWESFSLTDTYGQNMVDRCPDSYPVKQLLFGLSGGASKNRTRKQCCIMSPWDCISGMWTDVILGWRRSWINLFLFFLVKVMIKTTKQNSFLEWSRLERYTLFKATGEKEGSGKLYSDMIMLNKYIFTG